MLMVDIKTGQESPADPFQLLAYGKGYMAFSERGSTIPGIDFFEKDHTYKIKGGRQLPSVTQITRALINPEYYTPGSAEKGTYRHKCCQYWDEGILSYDELDSEDQPYVDAWYEFLVRYSLEVMPVLSEVPFYHPAYLYAGTIDRIYMDYEPGELLLWNVYLKCNGKARVKNRLADPKEREIAFNDFLVLKRTVDLQIKAGKNLERIFNRYASESTIQALVEVAGELKREDLKEVVLEITEALKINQNETKEGK